MNAPAATRRKQPTFGPNAQLETDAAFLAIRPNLRYRAREATAGEVLMVQALERRLFEVEAGCGAVAFIHLTDQGHRRKVVVEACEFTVEAMTEAEISRVFAQVVAGGWTVIEWRPL